MEKTILNDFELNSHFVGEPLTITAVMTVILAAVMAVVVYRLFMSGEGSVTIPGGWKFSWE